MIQAIAFAAMFLHQFWSTCSNDLEVLQNFHQQLKSPNVLTTWDPSNPCSLWEGVTCLGDGVTVTSLVLQNKSLQGTISPSLGNLKHLQHLNLSHNNFSGNIPAEIGNCSNLVSLELNDNSLTGMIPASLVQISNIEIIALEVNDLEGGIPPGITGLARLEVLSLWQNRLSGNVLDDIGRLTELQLLALSDNKLTGTMPPSLGNCTNLQILRLQDNFLTGGIPPEIEGLRNLRKLDLTNNRFEGRIPAEVAQLQKLEQLYISNNQLSGPIIPQLAQLASLSILQARQNKFGGTIPDFKNISELDLSFNNLIGTIPPSFAKLPLLRLYLNDNSLHGQLPEQLGQGSHLVILYLSNNSFDGLLPPDLCHRGFFRRVYLQNNKLSGGIPNKLFMCSTLERVFLQNNMLTGEIPKDFSNNANLTYLDLSQNFLNGSIPAAIGNCRNLTALFLGGNNFSGVLPVEAAVEALQELNASSNRLTGNLPLGFDGRNLFMLDLSHNLIHGPLSPEIQKMKGLQKLFLQDNHFNESVPAVLGSFENLQILELGSNWFSGTIPAELGQLQYLSALGLGMNEISGHIPPQLSNLQVLNRLDLSQNHLEGAIPQQLQQLVSLEQLNISYNPLLGPVPSFWSSRFNSSSFLGLLEQQPVTMAPVHQKDKLSTAAKAAIYSGISFCVLSLCGIICCLWTRRRTKPASMVNVNISLEALLTATNGLNPAYIIGEGSYGTVFKATMASGLSIAVKKLKTVSEEALQSFMQEWKTAGQVRHRNVQKILAFYRHQGAALLVYEFMPNGCLGMLLHSKLDIRLPWHTRYRIALDVAHGLAYLHHDCNPKIVHRDIKSKNILLDEALVPQIADFGLAKLIEDEAKAKSMSYVAGSYGYIAPEYTYTLRVNEKSDIYSFGVVLLELLLRKSPLDPTFQNAETSIVAWARAANNSESVIDPELWQTASPDEKREIELVLKIALFCTDSNPSGRPTMRETVEMLRQARTFQPSSDVPVSAPFHIKP